MHRFFKQIVKQCLHILVVRTIIPGTHPLCHVNVKRKGTDIKIENGVRLTLMAFKI